MSGIQLPDIVARIRVDTQGVGAGIETLGRKTSKAFKGMESAADKYGDKMQVAGAVGVAAVGALAYSSIKAASDLEESQNAVQKAYRESGEAVLALGEESATSYGMSENAFRSFAVTFSGFARQIADAGGGDVAGTLDEITTRVSDFASVMNLELPEAALVWQQTLAGETEAAKRFGIDVSDAAVKAHALATGIADAGGELTNNEKVLARQSLLMQETALYAGDFADTSGSLANQQRILAAEWENARAELGSSLLPIMTSAVGAANNMVQAFAGLPTLFRNTGLGIGFLGSAALLAAPKLFALHKEIVNGIGYTKAWQGALKGGIAAAILLLGTYAAASAQEVLNLANELDGLNDKGGNRLDDYRAKVDELRESHEDLWNNDDFGDLLGDIVDGTGTAIQSLLRWRNVNHDNAKTLEESEEKLREYDRAVILFRHNTGISREEAEKFAATQDVVGKGVKGAAAQLAYAYDKHTKLTPTVEESAGAAETLADSTASAADQADALNTALENLTSTAEGMTNANINYEETWDDLTAAIKENGASLNIDTEAGRANAKELLNINDAALQAAEAVMAETGEIELATEAYSTKRQALIDHAVALGYDREEAEKLIGKVKEADLVSALMDVDIDVTGDDDLADAKKDAQWFDGKNLMSRVQIQMSTSGWKGVPYLDPNVKLPLSSKVSTPGWVLNATAIPKFYADGGPVVGPGTGTSDSIPVMASNGEYIVRAASVTPQTLPWLEALNSGSVRGFSQGGVVTAKPTAAPSSPTVTPPNVGVRVYLGQRELTDIVRVEVSDEMGRQVQDAYYGNGMTVG